MADGISRQGGIEEQRHSTLYMDDGDLVISAILATDGGSVMQLFRVHKLILALQSPVFKDMLSIGENSNNEEYDGAPRVHLKEDPADDLAGLIGALYNPATLPLNRLSPDTPQKVKGIMRLATKYQMDTVRTIIIRHIEADWPTNLADWERRNAEMRQPPLSEPYDASIRRSICDYSLFPEPTSAIRFAMEFDCPNILPAAFYDLARAANIVEWEAGSLLTADPRPVRWQSLHCEDFLRLLKGKQQLQEWWRSTESELKTEVWTSCNQRYYNSYDHDDESVTLCTRTLKRLLRCVDFIPVTDPLSILRDVEDHADEFPGESEPFWCCSSEGPDTVRTKCRDFAQQLWDDLPRFFELEELLGRSDAH